MALALPIATATDLTDIPGVPKTLVGPPGKIIPLITTVLAHGRPVLTLGATVTTHGNPYNPKLPGFNPPCAAATILGKVVPNVLVSGKPVAVANPLTGSVCTCGHIVAGPGDPTILVGLGI